LPLKALENSPEYDVKANVFENQNPGVRRRIRRERADNGGGSRGRVLHARRNLQAQPVEDACRHLGDGRQRRGRRHQRGSRRSRKGVRSVYGQNPHTRHYSARRRPRIVRFRLRQLRHVEPFKAKGNRLGAVRNRRARHPLLADDEDANAVPGLARGEGQPRRDVPVLRAHFSAARTSRGPSGCSRSKYSRWRGRPSRFR